MKLAKLSLATIAVIGLSTSSFAADTLADAFKDGKLKGEIRAYYFDRDVKTGSSEDIFTTGILLDYKTASFKGFKLGAVLQSSSSPFATEEAKTEFKSDMWGSGAQLTNAYASYKIAKTTVKVGRQYIKSPLVRSSGSRLVVQAFEGTTVVSNAIPKTVVLATYVDKFQARTDGVGGIAEFEKISDDGAYSIMARTKFIPNTTFTAQYLDVKDDSASKDYQLMYVDGKYVGKAGDFGYNISAQYLDSQRTNGSDSDIFATKVGIDKGPFSAYVAYSKVDEANAPKLGLGSSVYGVYYTGSTISAGAGIVSKKGYEAYAIDTQYKIAGAKIGARYVTVEEPNGDKINIPGGFISYKFAGTLKGLNAHLAYEQHNFDDNTPDNYEMRFKAAYKF